CLAGPWRPSNLTTAYNPAGWPASETKRARCRQPIHAAGAARSPSAAARSNCSPHPPTAAAKRSCSRTGSRSISWWSSSAPGWRLHGPSASSQVDARWKSPAEGSGGGGGGPSRGFDGPDLKAPSAPSGEWSDDDLDVLAKGGGGS